MNEQLYIVEVVNEFGGTDFFCDMYASLEEAKKGFALDLPKCKIVEIKKFGEKR